MKKRKIETTTNESSRYDIEDVVHSLKDVVNVLYLLLKRVEGISHQLERVVRSNNSPHLEKETGLK